MLRSVIPDRRRSYDVVVVGAGIAGLTSAYLLQREGLSVALYERNEVGSGESGRTSAHVSSAIDDGYERIIQIHGEKAARLAAGSQIKAITLIERIIAEESIECDARRVPGYLFLGPEHEPKVLDREYVAAMQAGLRVEMVDPLLKSFSPHPWLLFRNQLQFHPAKYLAGLANAFIRLGGVLHTRCEVKSVEWPEKTRALITVDDRATEHDSPVEAKFVVIATHTPFVDRLAIHTKQAAYRTYCIAAHIPRESLPNAFFWDTSDPYHYIRLERDSDEDFERVIIGGEDHKVGQDSSPEMHWKKLEAWARHRIHGLGEVTHRWSGQIMETVDGLGFAGRNPLDSDHSFVITGDSGDGLTNATIGARIVADQIQNRENPYAELFAPDRIRLTSSGEYLKENLNSFAQYTDHLHPSELDSVAELARGQGAVIRVDGKPLAIHRDLAGRLKACSAICPHLGAVVHWNAAERSWDCPAHGSRFDCDGKVLNGPAHVPLEMRNLVEKPKHLSEVSFFSSPEA